MPISPQEVGIYDGIDGLILSECIAHIDKILRIAAKFPPYKIPLPKVDLSEFGFGICANPGWDVELRKKLKVIYQEAGWRSVTFTQRNAPNDTIVLTPA